MKRFQWCSRRTFLVVLLVCGMAIEANAQRSRVLPNRLDQRKLTGKKKKRANRRKKKSKTDIQIVILTGKQGVGVQAQQWRPILKSLGHSVRIRIGTSRDKIGVREQKLGPLRKVFVTGQLDRRGNLVFPDRKFSRADKEKLTEWLRELETYGAQGTPKGKPLWGLTKKQFGHIYSGLSVRVTDAVAGQPLEAALTKMGLPEKYPHRLSTDARASLRDQFATIPKVKHSLKDMSKGTALAILLSEYGLGFRPLRTPEGNMELVIDPLPKTDMPWPIGWKLKQKRRYDAAPELFKQNPIELDDVKISAVFELVSGKTGIPIHVDFAGIAAAGIQFDKLKVTYPLRRTSWSLLLRRVAVPNKLNWDLKRDESGQLFIWVRSLVPIRLRR